MSTRPLIWCAYDFCCQFAPEAWNTRYCPEHRCKRRAENAVKRLLQDVDETPEVLWEEQEQRKRGRMETAQAKNEWLLARSKVVFFDIETFDLAAEFGMIMVGCVGQRGGATQTFVAHGEKEERACIVGIRDTLELADYVVTWYGTKFDLPYLNTRLLINDERPVNRIRHIDLYYTSRFKLRLQSNRLANVELSLLGASSKTVIMPGIWRRALQGDQEALDYIVDHCQKDVDILAQVFERLRGFVNLSATRWRKYGASY